MSSAPIEGSVHAWDILDANFTDAKGIIKRKDKSYRPSPRECDAIDHLCAEWDYDWEGSSVENCPSHVDHTLFAKKEELLAVDMTEPVDALNVMAVWFVIGTMAIAARKTKTK